MFAPARNERLHCEDDDNFCWRLMHSVVYECAWEQVCCSRFDLVAKKSEHGGELSPTDDKHVPLHREMTENPAITVSVRMSSTEQN